MKRDSPGPTVDGNSWGTAYHTITEALNAAASGDQVWVAANTYTEEIVLKSGVTIKGSYLGTGTARNYDLYPTTIAAPASGSTIVTGANNAVIDGFALSGGYCGVDCNHTSPTINRCIVTGSTMDVWLKNSSATVTWCRIVSSASQAILVQTSTPTITHNTIAGGGVGVQYQYGSGGIVSHNTISGAAYQGINIEAGSSPKVINNIVMGNRDGIAITGATSKGCTSLIANNTVAGNYLGISVSIGAPKVFNNIAAFNEYGIVGGPSSSGTPQLSHNCVCGNTAQNYQGMLNHPSDIYGDPAFASVEFGNFHILPGSSCMNAGDANQSDIPTEDIDGQNRVFGRKLDIGADESYNETYPSSRIVYVDATRPPDGNGNNWASAFQSIQAAVDDTVIRGGAEIWVARGTYSEQVKCRPFAYLYGGFAGTEKKRRDRDYTANASIIDGTNGPTGQTMVTTARKSLVDGLTIRNGYVGVNCGQYCPVQNNVITGHLSTGVSCGDYSVVTGNTISRCQTGVYASGIHPQVVGNIITDNSGGAGIYVLNSATMINNVVARNNEGINCQYNAEPITNNTIVSNANAGVLTGYYSMPIQNNIIAFNGTGIRDMYSSPTPTLTNNDIYGNTTNYVGVTKGATDMSADPLFVNRAAGDYHLRFGSACVDAGANTGAPSNDVEGIARPLDGDRNGVAVCDIGAYEYPMNQVNAKTDYPDGSLVDLGFMTVTAAFPTVGCIYVERDDRVLGLRVNTSQTFAEGTVLNVFGTMGTDTQTGERYVQAADTYPRSVGTAVVPRPLAMLNSALAGGDSGFQEGVSPYRDVNNMGLLVTSWGSVVAFDNPDNPSVWFRIDDGCNLMVRVTVPPGVSINKNWRYVIVTGISSSERLNPSDPNSKLIRVIKVRRQSDVVMVN